MASFVRDYYGGTLINNYTFTNIPENWTASGGTRYSPAITYNHTNTAITEGQLKVFTDEAFDENHLYYIPTIYDEGTFTGLSEDLWDLSNGMMPIMKSALNTIENKMTPVGGQTITAGDTKQFTLIIRVPIFRNLSIEVDDVGSTIAMVSNSWESSTYSVTARSTLLPGDKITVNLKYFGRVAHSIVYTVV
jgi:hypothetical protein